MSRISLLNTLSPYTDKGSTGTRMKRVNCLDPSIDCIPFSDWKTWKLSVAHITRYKSQPLVSNFYHRSQSFMHTCLVVCVLQSGTISAVGATITVSLLCATPIPGLTEQAHMMLRTLCSRYSQYNCDIPHNYRSRCNSGSNCYFRNPCNFDST
jgi:hypothetical protein